MKTKYTKKINGLVETFTLQRTRKDRNCHICKSAISKGDEYANIKFWVRDITMALPVCEGCANNTPIRKERSWGSQNTTTRWVVDS